MDSLTLFGHLFKTRCEAICIFLDFFTEKRGSHREIYDFFRKNHETHCICKRFSIYCNKNCSGNMQILCPFAETTYAPSGDENNPVGKLLGRLWRNNLHPARGRKHHLKSRPRTFATKQLTPRQGTKTNMLLLILSRRYETTYTPSGDENCSSSQRFMSAAKQLTPRQGTKNLYPFMLNPSCLKQLTPRQGTKTRTSISKVLPCDETTYTPSGDENLPELVCFATAKIRNNLRPVRGRKLHFVRLNALHLSGNNLHPVRGRKSGQP